ncbi:MAG: MBOAT family protein [Bacilli bacterium]|nr:MBOAT family protein [Bacilli bacterium]
MIYNALLLIASILIYFSFGIKPFLFIVFSTLSTYIVGRFVKGRKWLLIISIIVNVLILGYFKFFIDYWNGLKLIVPLGISYYTLQVISYLVDVYKGKYKYESNLLYLALFVTYIPHLYIGPISRYEDVKKELVRKKSFDWNRVYEGLQRIVWGLFKKLIIAARISILISNVTSNEMTGIIIFVCCLLYSIELYSDFSGGIDIVLGISKILDIKLVENFDSPYLAENMKEFWGRWHISLGSWLKDYVYIPLGGNRKGKFRQCLNVIITFLVSGIWHGLNYIVWGLINGILVVLGNKYNCKYKWVNRAINFVIVSLLWIFFIYQDNLTSLVMFTKIFDNFKLPLLSLGLNRWDLVILGISTLILVIYDVNKDKILKMGKKLKVELKTVLLCLSIIIVIVFGIYGIGFEVTDFIYSKF